METVYDTYSTSDAANEVCGLLEFNGYSVYVKTVNSNTFEVIIVD